MSHIGQYVYCNCLLTSLFVIAIEINLIFLIKLFFLLDQKFMIKTWIFWERKEPLRWNKKSFFIIFKEHSMKQIKQLIWKVRVQLWYCCSHYSIISKTMSQFFEVLIFNQEIWGNVHYVCEINLIFKETLIKPFCLPIKASWKKSETQFCRRKTVEDYNAKIKVSPNI